MEGEDFSLSEAPPHCIFAGTTGHLHTPGHNVLRHSIVAVQVIKKVYNNYTLYCSDAFLLSLSVVV